MSEWISVEEKLPEFWYDVLTYDRFDGVRIAEYKTNPDKELWWEFMDGTTTDAVTHWMPLPEPPKEPDA